MVCKVYGEDEHHTKIRVEYKTLLTHFLLFDLIERQSIQDIYFVEIILT